MRPYVDAVSQQLRTLVSPVKGIEYGEKASIASIPEITGNRLRAEKYIIQDIHKKTLDERHRECLKKACAKNIKRKRKRGPKHVQAWHKEGYDKCSLY